MRLQEDLIQRNRVRRWWHLSLAVVVLFTSTAAIAVIFEPPAGDIKIPSYTPQRVPFRAGQRLVYHVSWAGLPAADVTIDMRSDPAHPELLVGEIKVATNKLVDIFYRMRDYVRENFARDSLAPRDVYIQQSENRRRDEYVINFDHRAGVVDMLKRGSKRSDDVKFHSPNPVGPISGPLMALSQPLQVGSTLVFDAFVGHNRYVIALKVERRERLQTAMGDFDTLRITPTMLYVSDNQVTNKAREVTIWVTDDQRHLPLRVQAEAFIGHITADLVRVADIDTYSKPEESEADPKPSAGAADHAP